MNTYRKHRGRGSQVSSRANIRFPCSERQLRKTEYNILPMPVKLIALDIDGTLLDSVSEISDANLKAIAAAADRGIEVALVTGRRFHFALPIARKIPSPVTMIVNNGALVKSTDGATHLRHLLPRETAR